MNDWINQLQNYSQYRKSNAKKVQVGMCMFFPSTDVGYKQHILRVLKTVDSTWILLQITLHIGLTSPRSSPPIFVLIFLIRFLDPFISYQALLQLLLNRPFLIDYSCGQSIAFRSFYIDPVSLTFPNFMLAWPTILPAKIWWQDHCTHSILYSSYFYGSYGNAEIRRLFRESVKP